jgi:hypothetical protein
MRKLFFWAFFLVLFSSAFSYYIEGDKVIYQNQFARLTVYPHTSSDPTKQHKQFFYLENLKDETYNDVQIGYFFNEQPSGDVLKYNPDEWGIVRKASFDINLQVFDWNYEIVEQNLNPYHVTVFHFDSNAPTKPIIFWEGYASDSNMVSGKRRIYIDYNQIIQPAYWNSIKHKFNYYGLTESGHFYYSDKFDVAPFKTYLWKLVYETEAESGKWALVAFKGSGPSCVLNDTCDKLWYIDPWFNQTYAARRQICITNNSPYAAQDSNVPVKITITNEFGLNALENCNDVRIVFDNEIIQRELDRNAIGNCQSDANLYFDLNQNINPYQTDCNYWTYYDNSGAATPDDAILVNGSPDSKSAVYCPFDYNTAATQSTPNLARSHLPCYNSGAFAYVTTAVKGGRSVERSAATIGVIDTNFVQAGYTAMTYEMWVYFSSASLARFFGATVNVNDTVQILQESSAPVGHIRAVSLQDGATLHDLDSRVVPSTGWHHVLYTCGGLGAKLYLDWNLVASNANTQCTIQAPATAPLYLGAPYGWGTEFSYQGMRFDELRITPNYQRVFIPQKDFNASTVYPSVVFGEAETLISDFQPYVDFNYPNGGEQFNVGSNPLIEVKIKIINDQNWVLLDLNYSSFPTIGGGTPIFMDLNTGTNPNISCTADYNDANNGSLCTYFWNVSALTDGNYYLLASVLDGNQNKDWDATDADFNIFTLIAPPFDINSTYERYYSEDDSRRTNVYSVEKFDYFLWIFMVFGVVVIGGFVLIIMRG